MRAVVKREDSRFILRLNKKLYKQDIIDKLVVEDKDWVRKIPSEEKYFRIELETKEIKDVLSWANYLLYLSRSA